MRENFQQLIKFCGTLTDPAAETKSIGLPADARVVMVFAPDSYREPSGQIYHDVTTSTCLPGLAKTPPYQLMIITLYSYIRELSLIKRPCTTDFL